MKHGRYNNNMTTVIRGEQKCDFHVTVKKKANNKTSSSTFSIIGMKEKSAEEVGGTSFAELTEMIKPLIIEEKGKSVKIKPKIVVSVTYQEIQRSPNYNSGWALRFPRFVALRPDKKSSQVSRLKEIEKDFAEQKRNWRYG